jgi:antitoxin VapB
MLEALRIMETRRVSLFRNGRSQAIRIPKEFEFPGREAILHRDGNRLVIEPVEVSDIVAWLATLEPLDEAIGPIEDRPPDDVTV